MEITDIYKEYNSLLKNFVSKRVNNKEDVQDLLQEIYIKLHLNKPTSDKEEVKRGWIFTIARNTIIDHYRKCSGKQVEMRTDKFISEEPVPAKPEGPDLTKCLHSFINELPAGIKEAVIDSEIKGISQKQLSQKYNIPYSSFRSRIQRARLKLKTMILDCCQVQADSRGNILEANCKKNLC
jgi:RNA polymerase sigma-70 factor, ECF subfamily